MSAQWHPQGEEAQNVEPRLRQEDREQAIRVAFVGDEQKWQGNARQAIQRCQQAQRQIPLQVQPQLHGRGIRRWLWRGLR